MKLQKRAIKLLELFKHWSRLGRIIRPSRQWIAGWLKCSIRTIQRVLNELYRGGFLRVKEYRPHRTSIYEVIYDHPKILAPEVVGTPLGTPVVKPESRRIERSQEWFPLVVFRQVYSRFAKWKMQELAPPKKNDSGEFDAREWGRLHKIGGWWNA